MLAACASSANRWAPAATAEPVTVSALAGAWLGQYDGRTYHRTGALALTLRADAMGGVTGEAVLGGVPASRRDGAFPLTPAERRAARSERVAVDSARVSGREVRLWLGPYWDGGCGCTVALTLRGALRGDTLAGAFIGEVAPTVTSEGRGEWRVVRARP